MLTAKITWAVDITKKEYFIQYRVKGTTDWIIPPGVNPTMNSFYDIPGLVEGNDYEFRIIANCCEGSTEEIIERTTPCPPTTSLTASTVDNSTVGLVWPSVDWAIGYNVYYKVQGDPTYILALGSPVPPSGNITDTLNVTGLTPTITYEFAVEVICANGTSNKVITTHEIPCPPISNLVLGFTNNTANLSWTSTLPGQTFRVEYKKSTDSTWTVLPNQNTTTASIPGLDYNQLYNFRVTGLCGTFPSNTLTADGQATCPPISNLTNSVDQDDVTLNWINGYSGQTVKIEHKVSTDSTWTLDVDNYGPASSYTVMNLPLGFTYDFRVTGKCGNFEINSLTTQATLNCPSVTSLTATNV